MISPEEIKTSCLKRWEDILILYTISKPFEQIEITRIGKVNSKDLLSRLSEYKSDIEKLKDNSKDKNGIGYRVVLQEQNFNKIKQQQVPEKILIDTIDDYLAVVGKHKEYDKFKANCDLILSELYILKDWIIKNPLRLIEHDTWQDTLKVCHYFLDTPKPNLYIRQLPIAVHTKYIKENEKLIESLLSFLIPDHIERNETRFERRFHLKYPEHLIRIKFLDPLLAPSPVLSDISIPLKEFKGFSCNCKNIIITENIMNFLTLPALESTIALWSGGGFKVSYLKNVKWIKSKKFFYWGDVDSHGFLILHQFRSYFDSVEAVMMDETTLKVFKGDIDQGPTTKAKVLSKLTIVEQNLYNRVRTEKLRLEQEKIPQVYSNQIIYNILKDK